MSIQIRDPVHRFIELRESQARLLDTPPLQRLRRIRQLAMANLVYPGALHTRFDHSLGVMDVAGRMATAVGMTPDEIETIRLAALLHDIGHGPFSHVSEHALDWHGDRSALPSDMKREKIHEVITAELICNDPSVVSILGSDTCKRISDALKGKGVKPAIKSVLSGPLDADKQDYLLRDSHFCGVEYGIYDIHQMHRSFVLEGPRDEEELMVDPDGIHSIEQFVMAKYYLTKNVYRHHVRLITDQMIVRAIAIGIEKDEIDELKALYEFDNSPNFIENYLKWDDARFLQVFCFENDGTRCARMLRRLVERNLLKKVFGVRPIDFQPKIREAVFSVVSRESADVRHAIEHDVAALLAKQTGTEIDPDLVIIHCSSVKSVRETSRNDEEGILVATSPPIPFIERSALFASINEANVEQSVDIYAPMSWGSKIDRNTRRREAKPEIIKIFEAHLVPSENGGST